MKFKMLYKISDNYVRNLASGSIVMGDSNRVGWVVIKGKDMFNYHIKTHWRF